MDLADKLNSLPDSPGVYLMKNEQGKVIYVGKARSLKNRVRTYFQASANHTPRVAAMVRQVADIEWIVTDTEVEALILEGNLIKKHRPRYNVRLRDDKSYPYLKLTLNEEFPRLLMVRRVQDDGARYYGPYPEAGALRETLSLLKKIFPLRSCKKKEIRADKPCLNFHIRRCSAPCTGNISREEYREMAERVRLFLEGKGEELLRQLERQMKEAAARLEFERAARLRDQVQALRQVLERQKVAAAGGGDRDVVAVYRGEKDAVGVVFFIRGGKMVGRDYFALPEGGQMEEEELVAAFLKQFYGREVTVPPEIIVPVDLEDREVIAGWLTEKRGKKVQIIVPRRGQKKELLEMAARNAAEIFRLWQEREGTDPFFTALRELKDSLGLEEIPRRIEAYDISNLQGTEPVASMVVFVDGRPAKDHYRRFNLRTVAGPDDYAAMREVIERRLRRLLHREDEEDPSFAAVPDLILIDGGLGQVRAAAEVAAELGLSSLPLLGLAKREELLYSPHRSEPLRLPFHSRALRLLQHIRDEAHRFALTHHRRRRKERSLVSVLDQIPGIGEKRKKALLQTFGSVAKIATASEEELAAVPGMNRAVARRLLAELNKKE